MRLLVDTHAYFWWLRSDRKLSPLALQALEDARNEILVSSVVAWELATKSRLDKWPEGHSAVRDIERFIAENGLQALTISITHARRAGLLPGRHRDPFDRLLAAQSELENASLVTADPVFASFGVTVLW